MTIFMLTRVKNRQLASTRRLTFKSEINPFAGALRCVPIFHSDRRIER